jgi:tetratricopeptide (TPR) repeat protein
MKALLTLRTMMLGATAILAFTQTARADFGEDQQICNQGTAAPDLRIAACTRQAESGKWEGHNLGVVYSNRSTAYLDKGDPDRAMADLNQALKFDPRYAPAYLNRGNAYAQKKDYDRAIPEYNQALDLDPKYVLAYNGRGNAYTNKKDYDRALADFNRAVEIDPKYAVAVNGRGVVYANRNDFDRAIAEYTQSIQLDPKYALAYNNRAIAHKAKGDLDHAISDYTQVVALNPSIAAYFNRAAAYMDKRDYDRAITDYTKALEINPRGLDLLNNRAVAYRNKGDLTSAMADYTQQIQLDPKSWSAYLSRGHLAVLTGALPLAVADLDKAAELSPRNAYIALWADIASKRGKTAGHLAEAAKQVEMASWPGPVISFYLGQSTSEALLAAANSGDPAARTNQTCGANFYIGESLLLQGKQDDAARLFRLAADASCQNDLLEYESARAELKALNGPH